MCIGGPMPNLVTALWRRSTAEPQIWREMDGWTFFSFTRLHVYTSHTLTEHAEVWCNISKMHLRTGVVLSKSVLPPAVKIGRGCPETLLFGRLLRSVRVYNKAQSF